MDAPPMHFAVGMICGGLLWLPVLLVRPRWWIYMPLVMTAGGLWAEGPDLPLIPIEYPSIPGSSLLRGHGWSDTLHGEWANLFFFHGWIDRGGEGGMLKGWVITIALYAGWIVVLIGYIFRLRRSRPQATGDA
jgi:hypothetical protein